MMYDVWCMMYDRWCMTYVCMYNVAVWDVIYDKTYDVWHTMYGVWWMMYDVWCMIYDGSLRKMM